MSLHDTFKYLMDAYRATSICVPTERIVSGVTGRRTDRFLGKAANGCLRITNWKRAAVKFGNVIPSFVFLGVSFFTFLITFVGRNP